MSMLPAVLEEFYAPRRLEKVDADERYWDLMVDGLFGIAEPESHVRRFQGGMEPFIRETLDFDMWPIQEKIVQSIRANLATAVRSCHAAGKSAISARIALAYLHEFPESIVVTTAPTNRQVENVLWRYINAAAAKSREPLLGRAMKTRYEIAPDWYGIGFTGNKDNTDAMQGYHAENILVIVDEAAGVHEGVMENIESNLTGTGARLLLIGNPTSISGSFRAAFHESADAYHGIKISAYDTPNFTYFGVTREDMLSGSWEEKICDTEGNPLAMPYRALIDPRWVHRQMVIHGPDSAYVRSRVDAEFPDDDGTTLISLAALDVIDQMAGTFDMMDAGLPFSVGIDCARFGEDENSLVIRQGRASGPQFAWRGMDNVQGAGETERILGEAGLHKGNVTINIDSGGQGAGIGDILLANGWNVNRISFGGKSSDSEKWPIIRHELWWQFRERVREGAVAPMREGRMLGRLKCSGSLDDLAKAQLSDVKYTYDTRSRVLIEEKAAAKKRGVRSPDRAEAMILAFYDFPAGEREGGISLALPARGGGGRGRR